VPVDGLTVAVPGAIAAWRALVGSAHPLYGARQVVVTTGRRSEPAVEFYTDARQIYVDVNDGDRASADFEGTVKTWADAGSAVTWNDVLVTVLLHEIYHPLVCPDSLDDEREISCALFRGLARVHGGAAPTALLSHHVKNLFWDLVVNVTLLARLADERRSSLGRACRRAGRSEALARALPALYFQSAAAGTADGLLAVMGALYTALAVPTAALRKPLLAVFDGVARQAGLPGAWAVAAAMAKAMLAGAGPAGTPAGPATDAADEAALQAVVGHGEGPARRGRERVLEGLLARFDGGATRYDALAAAAEVLAPYIGADRGTQGSPDARTRGHRGAADGDEADDESVADTLPDLAEGLSGDELDELQQSVGAVPTGTATSVMAADRYYRTHATALSLRTRSARPTLVGLGKRHEWRLANVQSLTAADLAGLDMGAVQAFQHSTKLPVLLSPAPGRYQLNEWRVVERPLKAWTAAEDLAVPDNWVLVVDSSGSMASQTYVGDGGRYDLLMRICYGVALGLHDATERLGRDLQWGVVNFSSSTRFSGMAPFRDAFGAVAGAVKRALLVPECGGTELDLDVLKSVEAKLAPGSAVYTVVTDGEISGDTAALVGYLVDFARRPDHTVLFVEIACTSQFGSDLRASAAGVPSVACRSVASPEDVEPALGSVLVTYDLP